MVKILLVLLLLLNTAHAEEGWFPYWFPADPATAPDYMGVPASTFNAGKDVLDPPAGKHGFVQVKNGHFYFEDGTRARFWGTNLCFGACFPEHRDAEVMANRIAYFGFNAVRLHHMDMLVEPDGIWESTGKISPRQLDKLDYLVFQLKQRGIYININTLVSRNFEIDAKPICMFDAKLIELQKQYDKDLLTHLNPYTKLRYCEDPAVCAVEIINECTLIELDPSSLPEYYRKEYNTLFDKWLADRGHAPKERVPIAQLSPDITLWEPEEHSDASMTKKVKGEEVTLEIKKTTGTDWHLQYRYTGAKLKKNKGYMFEFTAKGNTPFSVVSQQACDPWQWLGLSGKFDLTNEFRTFEVPFTATDDCEDAKIGFIVGYAPGTITLKDVSFSESSKTDEIREFKVYLETKYLAEMKEFLNTALGIKCPVGIGGHWNKGQVEIQESVLDYIDKHAYWDHPQFPRKQWDNTDFRIDNKSIFLNKDHGILNVFRSIPEGKPRVLSEWMHCYPNKYAYETPTLLAAEARIYDWDGVYQFAFSHGWGGNTNYDNIDSYFNINPNAQQLILCSYGSRIFLKAERGTVPKVGEIKNTGSGWNSEGRFEWGTAPTLMKK